MITKVETYVTKTQQNLPKISLQSIYFPPD